MTMANNSKVAVVVVHGVADDAPGASARAASELLHGLRTGGKPSPYGPDTQETISIPLKQLKISERLDKGEESWLSRVPLLGIFVKALEERSVFLTRAWKKTPPPDEPESVANDFMRLLLQDYHGVDDPVIEPAVYEHDDAASYVTTCIKMTREATPSSPNNGVEATGSIATSPPSNPPSRPRPLALYQVTAKKEGNTYDGYWAYLSTPKNKILSFFAWLYQWLFPLGSL